MNKVLLYLSVWALLTILACKPNRNEVKITSIDFLGKWVWEKSSRDSIFSIEIFQQGDSLLGTYCGSIEQGAKMDCGINREDIAFGFVIKNEPSAIFGFESYTENDKGKASLTLTKGKLLWHIIDAPKTKHYAWKDAVLVKVK